MVRFEVSCELPFPRADFWRLRASPSFLKFVVDDGMLKKMSCTPATTGDDGWSSRELSYVPARVHCPAAVRAVVGDTAFAVTDSQRWNDAEEPFSQQFSIRPSFLQGISQTFGELALEDMDESGGSDVVLDDASVGSSEQGFEEELDADADADADAPASDVGSLASEPTCSDPSASTGDLNALPVSEKCVHAVRGEVRVSIFTVGWFVERAIVQNLRLFYQEYPASIARFRAHLVEKFAQGDESVPISEVVDRFLEREAEIEEEAMKDADSDESSVTESEEENAAEDARSAPSGDVSVTQ